MGHLNFQYLYIQPFAVLTDGWFFKEKDDINLYLGECLMLKLKIKVGNYYELKLDKNQKIAFGVMYGFDSGKNKDVYALMMYTKNKIFEFPIQKNLFEKWVDEGRVKEITSDEALVYAL